MSLKNLFTFQYGSIKGNALGVRAKSLLAFTFQYGSIKGKKKSSKWRKVSRIYIPIWFY